MTTMPELPAVCDAGMECRKQISDFGVYNIDQMYTTVWENIMGSIESTLLMNRMLVKAAWDEMAECDPECRPPNIERPGPRPPSECEEVMTEWDEIVMLMKEITEEKNLLREELYLLGEE